MSTCAPSDASRKSLLAAGKRIAISGAGISGTALALALEQACKARGINPMPAITIYERDASANARENVGYSFSLKQEGETGPGGLQASTFVLILFSKLQRLG